MKNRLIKIVLFVGYLLFTVSSYAQSPNLIPNSKFEEFSVCPQDYTYWNSVYRKLTTGWTYPTKGTPDYFNKCSRGIAGVPRNFAGTSNAYSGKGYVGIVARGSRRNYREYIQAKLKDTLQAGVKYCIQFKYKLSSYSRYGIDRLGVYFSPKQIRVDYDIQLSIKPQVENEKENWMDNKVDWGSFCGVFEAQGNETNIIIGNFYNDDSTDVVETDISDVHPKRVRDYAYYYIDDVELHSLTNCYVCSCSKDNTIDAEIIPTRVRTYGGSSGAADLIIHYGLGPFTYLWSNNETTQNIDHLKAGYYFVEVADANGCKHSFDVNIEQPDTVFATVDPGVPKRLKNVLFYFDKIDFLPNSYKQLDDLVAFLEDHPTLKIKILGHTDERGKGNYNMDLSEKRAKAVVNYLISKGIDKGRLSFKGYGETRPLADNSTEKGRQLNRRVEFEVVEE